MMTRTHVVSYQIHPLPQHRELYVSLTSSFRGTTRDKINFSKRASWTAPPSNVETIGSRKKTKTTPINIGGARA